MKEHTIVSNRSDEGNGLNFNREVWVRDNGHYLILGYKDREGGAPAASFNISRKAAEELLMTLDIFLGDNDE